MTAQTGASSQDLAPDAKRPCAYTQHSIERLDSLGRLIDHDFDCALVFNDQAPDWYAWQHPWFTKSTEVDKDWTGWKIGNISRLLIVSPGLVPSTAPADWRQRGAAGEYDVYYRTFASDLVRAGLGDSVIRLAHEGNGEWFHHWFGDNGADQQAWKATWRRAALAMKSVPGARFIIDWNVAAGFDNVPLAWYYPGDDVVDVVGFDYYDLNVMTTGAGPDDPDRWQQQYTKPNGPTAVIEFAISHGKPVSIPEWGLAPPNGRDPGGGDNPGFVEGISSIIKNNRVIYSGYFDDDANGTRLTIRNAPRSLTAYKDQFAH